ncbi:hypothetical protein CENSYa_1449 [Cenarchaeum symbiosum A]|uniref:Uncharacterized protein n=1 Tax=Cenarchaeum symbiosum (strain A) TaxID=414004 RepID=A0RXK4_CENSY|nr:hypothetical protein CENSYa_1449 [Cenarchaeum symbiosum A]
MISKTTKKTTYTATAIGFAAFFALMMTPSGAFSTSPASDITAYGMAEVVQRNGDGEILSSSVTHNRLLDAGETFILHSVFATSGPATADAQRLDTVCISDFDGGEQADASANNLAEGDTASTYPRPDGPSGSFACITDDEVDATTNQGEAVIGPLRFTTGTDIDASETVDVIAVCYDPTPGAPDLTDCGTLGFAFAAVDVPDVAPTGTDTVDVTYTFDLKSPDN